MITSNINGSWGETVAAAYLRRKRYTVLDCNYRCRFGEIDLIVQNRKFLVFVEVKLRKSDAFAEAREFVTAAKQERIMKTAMLWMQSHPTELQPRFDVIEIYAPQGTETIKPCVIHLEDAFS